MALFYTQHERFGVQIKVINVAIAITLSVITFIGGLMTILPTYNVWAQRMAGEARLAEALSSREIAVREAQAKKDSAVLLAEAEVERAKGVAQANKIIGDSLTNNEAYLRYLFVNNLENTKNQVIYVPTETNLPILEANRRTNNGLQE
jgi:regulator of protease activity HflC (stomatin/prohibitin superfamily)